MHTCTHTRTCARFPNLNAHARTETRARTCAHARASSTSMRTHARTETRARTCAHARASSTSLRTHARTQTRASSTSMCTHAFTQTCARTRARARSFPTLTRTHRLAAADANRSPAVASRPSTMETPNAAVKQSPAPVVSATDGASTAACRTGGSPGPGSHSEPSAPSLTSTALTPDFCIRDCAAAATCAVGAGWAAKD
eukprot:365566-Chlamydomonas_euryale.AAC.14